MYILPETLVFMQPCGVSVAYCAFLRSLYPTGLHLCKALYNYRRLCNYKYVTILIVNWNEKSHANFNIFCPIFIQFCYLLPSYYTHCSCFNKAFLLLFLFYFFRHRTFSTAGFFCHTCWSPIIKCLRFNTLKWRKNTFTECGFPFYATLSMP